MNLRQYACGKQCTVRIPGVCSHNPGTTVLAHKNGGGGGMKHNDIHGAWACSCCHSWLDTVYVLTNTRAERDAVHDEAIIRTQQELLKTENKHGISLAEAIEEWVRGLEL